MSQVAHRLGKSEAFFYFLGGMFFVCTQAIFKNDLPGENSRLPGLREKPGHDHKKGKLEANFYRKGGGKIVCTLTNKKSPCFTTGAGGNYENNKRGMKNTQGAKLIFFITFRNHQKIFHLRVLSVRSGRYKWHPLPLQAEG
jgi:hypothetical protein